MNGIVTALGNEVRKGLLFGWSERLFTVFILLLVPMLGAGHQIAAGHPDWTLNRGRISLLVIAFAPAMFFYFQAVKLFWRLLGEIQSGTIEQVYLSPLPSWLVAAAGRLVAALIELLQETMLLLVMVFAASPDCGEPAAWSGSPSPPSPTWPPASPSSAHWSASPSRAAHSAPTDER